MILTPKQIEAIKKIINKHFNSFILFTLGSKHLSEADRKELESLGFFDEGVPNENIFHDAFKIGRTRSLANDALPKMDYKKWKEYILGMYLDDKDKNILENVDNSTSHYLNSLKDKITNRILTSIIDANKEAMLSNIGSPIGPSYERADREAIDIRKLAKELEETTKDVNRDWQKVVVTELNSAHSQGSIQSIMEDNKGKHTKDILVYCIGPLDAATCPYCRKFYHDGGSFKVYRLSELLANGTNIGLKVAQWRAVVPPMHPNCRHRLVELPQGYTLDEEGKTVFIDLKHHELNNNKATLKKSLKGKTPTFSGHKLQKRLTLQGMDISIENKKGSTRHWQNKDGESGDTTMLYDYGYIRNTLGKDKDHVDCYVGSNKNSKKVFVVHQNVPSTGKFDEDKVMLGFDNAEEAKEAYLKHYDNPDFFGSMTTMSIDEFKEKAIGKKNNLIKGGLQRGGAKSGHKYIKRTGGPGNYRYWYQDEKGRIYEGKNAPEEHQDFDKFKLAHNFQPKQKDYVAAKDFPSKTIVVKQRGRPAGAKNKKVKVKPIEFKKVGVNYELNHQGKKYVISKGGVGWNLHVEEGVHFKREWINAFDKIKDAKIAAHEMAGVPFVQKIIVKQVKQYEDFGPDHPRTMHEMTFKDHDAGQTHDHYAYAHNEDSPVAYAMLTNSPDIDAKVLDGINLLKPQYKDQEIEHELAREILRKHPVVISPDGFGMAPVKMKLWRDLQNDPEFQGKILQTEQGFIYNAEGMKDEDGNPIDTSTKFKPFEQDKNIHEGNADLVKSAQAVYNKFTTGDFNEIGEGVCGLKGIVEHEGQEYFVKSESGGFKPPEGEIELAPMTDDEMAYSSAVHTAFKDMSSYFPAKLKLSGDTFMQKKIEIHRGDFHDIVDRANQFVLDLPEEATKLALINYILGNKDRHSGNMSLSPDGDLKLFDEGLAIECAEMRDPRIPAYLGSIDKGRETNNYKRGSFGNFDEDLSLDPKDLTEYFNQDRKNACIQALRDNNIQPEKVKEFGERYDRLSKELNKFSEVGVLPVPQFLRKVITPTDEDLMDEVPEPTQDISLKDLESAPTEKVERNSALDQFEKQVVGPDTEAANDFKQIQRDIKAKQEMNAAARKKG